MAMTGSSQTLAGAHMDMFGSLHVDIQVWMSYSQFESHSICQIKQTTSCLFLRKYQMWFNVNPF